MWKIASALVPLAALVFAFSTSRAHGAEIVFGPETLPLSRA
jgi:hypothetical protein